VFVYDKVDFEATLGARENKPLIVMENGAHYTGEWLID
jgi:hypothetical protein